MPSRFEYKRISADQFRNALDGLGLMRRSFVRIFGVNDSTAKRWARGDQEIPIWVPVALELLKVPGALGTARMTAAGLIRRDNLRPELGEWPFMQAGIRALPEDFIDDDDE